MSTVISDNPEPHGITETERLAIEEAARLEGIRQAEEAATNDAAGALAAEAALQAGAAQISIDSAMEQINSLRDLVVAQGEQINNLTNAIDALAETVVDIPDDPVDDPVIDAVEQVPEPATEPKKRKRGWA